MAARPTIDERLSRLRAIAAQTDAQQIREAAVKALSDSCNLITAEAAKLIGRFELTGCEPALVSTWERLFKHSDPIKVDKGCAAKTAIIDTLNQLQYDDADLYLAGIVYRQLEPAWGPPEDTAEHVRAGCAFGLVRSRQLRTVPKLNALVDYLHGSRADRLNAIKALTDSGMEAAIPILRQKLRSGDGDAEVMGTCMSGLLSLDPHSSIPLVAEYLHHADDNLILEAAAALGGFGQSVAVNSLIAAWNRNVNGEIQKELLLSIGLSRQANAIDFLIEQLPLYHRPADVLEALKPACWIEEIRIKVQAAVQQVGDPRTIAAFQQMFVDRSPK